jgi:hypothetical protein
MHIKNLGPGLIFLTIFVKITGKNLSIYFKSVHITRFVHESFNEIPVSHRSESL